MTVTLFVPCFVDLCFPQVGMSMVKILERLGHQVKFHDSIKCCGQPAFNSGYWDEARAVAAPALAKFKDDEVVVIASGSCGAMLKVFYPELFAGTPLAADAAQLAAKCYEFSDFLVTRLGGRGALHLPHGGGDHGKLGREGAAEPAAGLGLLHLNQSEVLDLGE